MALPGTARDAAQQQLGKGLRPAHPKLQLQRISRAICMAHSFSVQRHCCKSANGTLEAWTAWCSLAQCAAQRSRSSGKACAQLIQGSSCSASLRAICMVQDCASQLHNQHLHVFYLVPALTIE